MMSQTPDPGFSLGKEEWVAFVLIGFPYLGGFKNLTKTHINAANTAIPSE